MLAFILMNKLYLEFLGFSDELVFTRILPATTANWCFIGAAMSVIGFTHSYVFTAGDVIGQLAIEWTKRTTGYIAMAAVLLLAPWFTRTNNDT